jgi:hypothetical protein
MLGEKENKSLLELFQCPKLVKEISQSIFQTFSWVRGTYRKLVIFDPFDPFNG